VIYELRITHYALPDPSTEMKHIQINLSPFLSSAWSARTQTAPFTGDVLTDVRTLLIAHERAATLEHCERVGAEAQRIAALWGVDAARAASAGWLHDISVVLPTAQYISLAEALGIEVLPAERVYPPILHQKLSAWLAMELFGITDAAILDAIACHTTLKRGATPLELVVFIADKMQWDQPGTPPYLREMLAALDISLTQAAGCYLRYLWEQRATLHVVHPWLVEAHAELLG